MCVCVVFAHWLSTPHPLYSCSKMSTCRLKFSSQSFFLSCFEKTKSVQFSGVATRVKKGEGHHTGGVGWALDVGMESTA